MAITESKYSYSKRNGIEKVNIKVDKRRLSKRIRGIAVQLFHLTKYNRSRTKVGDPVNVATGSLH